MGREWLITRARISLPTLGQCRVCLVWCVWRGAYTDISSVVQESKELIVLFSTSGHPVQRLSWLHTLGIALVQTTCIPAARNEKATKSALFWSSFFGPEPGLGESGLGMTSHQSADIIIRVYMVSYLRDGRKIRTSLRYTGKMTSYFRYSPFVDNLYPVTNNEKATKSALCLSPLFRLRAQPNTDNVSPDVVLLATILSADLLTWARHRRLSF